MDLEVTIRPTGRFEMFNGIECRIWEGEAKTGIPVEFLVPCVRSRHPDQGELLSALREIKAERQLMSFDTRLVV